MNTARFLALLPVLGTVALVSCATPIRTALKFPPVSSGSLGRAEYFTEMRDEGHFRSMSTWLVEVGGTTYIVNGMQDVRMGDRVVPLVELWYRQEGEATDEEEDTRTWELLGIAITVAAPGTIADLDGGALVVPDGAGSPLVGVSTQDGEGIIVRVKGSSGDASFGVMVGGELRRLVEARHPDELWKVYGVRPWADELKELQGVAARGALSTISTRVRQLGVGAQPELREVRAQLDALVASAEQVRAQARDARQKAWGDDDRAFADRWARATGSAKLGLYVDRAVQIQQRGAVGDDDKLRHQELIDALPGLLAKALGDGRVGTAAAIELMLARLQGTTFTDRAATDPSLQPGQRALAELARGLVPAVRADSDELRGAVERLYREVVGEATPFATVLRLHAGDAAAVAAAAGPDGVAGLSVTRPVAGTLVPQVKEVAATWAYQGTRKVVNPDYAPWLEELRAKEERLAELGDDETQARSDLYEKKLVTVHTYTVGGSTKSETRETDQSIADRQQAAIAGLAARSQLRLVRDEYRDLLQNEPPLEIDEVVNLTHPYTVAEQRWTGTLTRSVALAGARFDKSHDQKAWPLEGFVLRRVAAERRVGLAALNEWITEADMRSRLLAALENDVVATLGGWVTEELGRRIDRHLESSPAKPWSAEDREAERAWLRYFLGARTSDAKVAPAPVEPSRMRSVLVAGQGVSLPPPPALPRSLRQPLATGPLPNDTDQGAADHRRRALHARCGAANAGACVALGTMADGGAPHPALAIAAFSRGCDLGDAVGCRMLGGYYFNGTGVARDLAAEAWVRRRGCDLGDALSCQFVAWRYLEGFEGTAANPLVAQQLFRIACNEGLADACTAMSDVVR